MMALMAMIILAVLILTRAVLDFAVGCLNEISYRRLKWVFWN